MKFTNKTCTSLSTALRQLHEKYIEPFEDHLDHYREYKPPKSADVGTIDPDVCRLCYKGDEKGIMLLCDDCEKGYHLTCLKPTLFAVPNSDWYCPFCLLVTPNDYGFEDGGEYTLASFQAKADEFKRNYFPYPTNEDMVEEEFWRILSDPLSTLEVEYGADLHSTVHGSGFPTIERQPTDKLSRHPWNLNAIPTVPSSLFININQDISGMMVPWIYVGMCFSTFCWHNEDHYTYSVNYQHWGETKTWYGIPGSHAEAFESAVKKVLPELFDNQPDLLYQLVTMVSPSILTQHNVPVYGLDQRPNEFVITFPKAYHAGFNHGLNFNEAVNFAPLDWIPYGLDCVLQYKRFSKNPVFSHDELLINTALNTPDLSNSNFMRDAFRDLHRREKGHRDKIRGYLPDAKAQEMPSGDIFQCKECNVFCYLSAIGCKCDTAVVCADDYQALCSCDSESKILYQRYKDNELSELVDKIMNQASGTSLWQDKLTSALKVNRSLPLSFYEDLVEEAENIGVDSTETENLKNFVVKCKNWIYMAEGYLQQKDEIWTLPDLERDAIIDEIKDLITSANTMCFGSSELDALKDIVSPKNMLTVQITEALEDQDAETEYLNDLMAQAKELDIENSDTQKLKERLTGMQWYQYAQKLTAESYRGKLTLQDISSVLDQALQQNIPQDHPLISALQALYKQGEEWKKLANLVKNAPSVALMDIDYLISKSETFPHTQSLLDDLKQLKEQYGPQQAKVLQILEQCTATDFVKRPNYDDVLTILNDMNSLSLTDKQMYELEEYQKHMIQWIQSVVDAFGMVLNHDSTKPNQIRFNLEMLKLKIKCRIEKKTSLKCPCGQNPDFPTVGCFKCRRQYHRACLHINYRPGHPSACLGCEVFWLNDIRKRPSLDTIVQLVDLGRKLPFICKEFDCLLSISLDVEQLKQTCEKFRGIANPKEVATQIKHLAKNMIDMEVTIEEQSKLLEDLMEAINTKRAKTTRNNLENHRFPAPPMSSIPPVSPALTANTFKHPPPVMSHHPKWEPNRSPKHPAPHFNNGNQFMVPQKNEDSRYPHNINYPPSKETPRKWKEPSHSFSELPSRNYHPSHHTDRNMFSTPITKPNHHHTLPPPTNDYHDDHPPHPTSKRSIHNLDPPMPYQPSKYSSASSHNHPSSRPPYVVSNVNSNVSVSSHPSHYMISESSSSSRPSTDPHSFSISRNDRALIAEHSRNSTSPKNSYYSGHSHYAKPGHSLSAPTIERSQPPPRIGSLSSYSMSQAPMHSQMPAAYPPSEREHRSYIKPRAPISLNSHNPEDRHIYPPPSHMRDMNGHRRY
jgi:histone demethylase JARID1